MDGVFGTGPLSISKSYSHAVDKLFLIINDLIFKPLGLLKLYVPAPDEEPEL